MPVQVLLSFGQLIVGLIVLLAGGVATVRGAASLASHARLPPALIGTTLVAFGTSLPEFVGSVYANLRGHADIAVGNAAGSNIANIGLVLGITLLAAGVMGARGASYQPSAFARDCLFMLASCVCLVLFLWMGVIPRLAGAALVGAHLVYLFLSYQREAATEPPQAGTPFLATGLLIGGCIGLAVGAQFLVDGVLRSGEILMVPPAFLALSMVAIGTSLPELVTCLEAVRQKQFSLAIGNILGSNIFNITFILGGTSIIKAITFDPALFSLTAVVLIPVSLILTLIVFRPSSRLGDKLMGSSLLIAYGVFLYFELIR